MDTRFHRLGIHFREFDSSGRHELITRFAPGEGEGDTLNEEFHNRSAIVFRYVGSTLFSVYSRYTQDRLDEPPWKVLG